MDRHRSNLPSPGRSGKTAALAIVEKAKTVSAGVWLDEDCIETMLGIDPDKWVGCVRELRAMLKEME